MSDRRDTPLAWEWSAFTMLTRFRTSDVLADEFHTDLHTICGSFDARTVAGSSRIRRGIAMEHAAGIEVAHVAADLLQLVSTKREIRHDNSENYFLILQEEGRAQMS